MAKTVDEALFKITPQIQKLSEICEENNAIDKALYKIRSKERIA